MLTTATLLTLLLGSLFVQLVVQPRWFREETRRQTADLVREFDAKLVTARDHADVVLLRHERDCPGRAVPPNGQSGRERHG